MNPYFLLAATIISAFFGAFFAVRLARGSQEKDHSLRQKETEAALHKMASKALAQNTEQFFQLAQDKLGSQLDAGESNLEEKRKLIDQNIKGLTEELGKIRTIVKAYDRDGSERFGKLSQAITDTNAQTHKLKDTADKLREVLAGSQSRGQWGERMAEDVLRLAGFIEGINYTKQKALESGRRPDFTFLLPQGQKLNMDVKFPFDNYVRALEIDSALERERLLKKFFSDVRGMLKDVSTRDYIDPEGSTVDCALIFIPNEQVFSFLQQHQPQIMDEAFKRKLVMCSPLTLFAVLSVIRRATENFTLERTADELLGYIGAFQKQWEDYIKAYEKVGDKLDDAREAFETLTGTRTRMLDVQVRKIESLRKQKGVEPSPSDSDE